MNKQARVTSIQAIRDFKAALEEYQDVVADCLESLRLEVRRGESWVASDRMAYWPAQVRESSDGLTEAQNALERKQLTFGSNERPSATEEKKAVEEAKRRKQYCERRLANTKKWLRVISHEADEFIGMLAKVQSIADTELPKAIAKLDRHATALEKYTQITVATSSSPIRKANNDLVSGDDAGEPKQ